MCMRASEASELRKFRYFYILKLLFLSIFCRYIRCFVGTNDMLVGLHVPTNFQMYRQKSEKTLLGGGGQFPPPPPPLLPPPLATLMGTTTGVRDEGGGGGLQPLRCFFFFFKWPYPGKKSNIRASGFGFR